MTVEDTVTKSSSGQIGGPGLWRVSHKRRTTQPPLPPPPLLPLCSASDQVPIIGEATPWRGWEGLEMPVRVCSSVSSLCGSCEASRQTNTQTAGCMQSMEDLCWQYSLCSKPDPDLTSNSLLLVVSCFYKSITCWIFLTEHAIVRLTHADIKRSKDHWISATDSVLVAFHSGLNNLKYYFQDY